MARPRRRRLPKTPAKRGDQTRKVRIRRHTRSPRGNDAGKPRVRVRAHRRGRARKLPG